MCAPILLTMNTSNQAPVAVVTGANSGIGRATALHLAQHGYTVFGTVRSLDKAGKLQARANELGVTVELIEMDVADDVSVQRGFADIFLATDRVDVLVNNASAIWLRGILDTPMKRFDLMSQVNSRGTFLCAQKALPYLLKSENPHILTLAPPPNLDPKWWGSFTGYTLAKMGMSFVTLGLAEEFKGRVAVNALWPKTVIATDAINMIPGVDINAARNAEIVADAAIAILLQKFSAATGQFYIDEDLLRDNGVTDFEQYAMAPGTPLLPDFFL